jgi:hypothetical protein
MSKKYENSTDAINGFFATAIESNLVDLAKRLFNAFPSEISVGGHDIDIALYSAIRTESVDMLNFLFSIGAELDPNKLKQVAEGSSFDVFKSVAIKYQDFWRKQAQKGRSPLKYTIKKGRIQESELLKSLGFEFTPEVFPLSHLLTDICYNKGNVIYALDNINYSLEDYNDLNDYSKVRLPNALGEKATKEVIEAFEKSNLSFVLSLKDTVTTALAEGNQAILNYLIKNNINIDTKDVTKCSASNFVNDPSSFEIAVKIDPNAQKRDFYGKILVRNIILSGNVETLRIACEYVELLSDLKRGKLNTEELRSMIETAYRDTPSAQMLDAFFELLPANAFADKEVINSLFYITPKDGTISPVDFLKKSEEKGAVLDNEVFDQLISTVMSSNLQHYKAGEYDDKIELFKFGKERVANFYEKAQIFSDLDEKSEKQILSLFRKSYFSQNDNSKATQGILLMTCAPEEKRIEILNAMTSVDDLKQDIAFTEAMRIWGYNPISVLELNISNKVKAKVMEALG